MEADTDRDGKISFEEFTKMVENTDISMSMTLGTSRSQTSHVIFFHRSLDESLSISAWTIVIGLARLANHAHRSILIDIQGEH